jgi:hypothetical protein
LKKEKKKKDKRKKAKKDSVFLWEKKHKKRNRGKNQGQKKKKKGPRDKKNEKRRSTAKFVCFEVRIKRGEKKNHGSRLEPQRVIHTQPEEFSFPLPPPKITSQTSQTRLFPRISFLSKKILSRFLSFPPL